MPDPIRIAVLPVGEFDSANLHAEFDAILRVFSGLGAELQVAAPVSDAAAASEAVAAQASGEPDLLLMVPLRGLSAEAMEAAALATPAPSLIWPVRGRFALPSSTLAVGALRETGRPVELLFAPPDQSRVIDEARTICQAAHALARLRRSRIGILGGLFPNLVSARYDAATLHARLGVTLLPLPYAEVQAEMARPGAIEQAQAALNQTYTIAPEDQSALPAGLGLHLALKRLAQTHQLDAFAAECWSGLPPALGLNPCLGFTEDAYTLACEGDVTLGISLLLVQYLTGRKAYVGDLYDLDLDGVVTLVHCGAPASLARDRQRVVLGRSQVALQRGYETITCRPPLEPGLVTIFRFYGRHCDQLHLAMGELLSSQTTPNLTVTLRLAGSRWGFLERCAGNHYVVVPGDLRPALTRLARWLAITLHQT